MNILTNEFKGKIENDKEFAQKIGKAFVKVLGLTPDKYESKRQNRDIFETSYGIKSYTGIARLIVDELIDQEQ